MKFLKVNNGLVCETDETFVATYLLALHGGRGAGEAHVDMTHDGGWL